MGLNLCILTYALLVLVVLALLLFVRAWWPAWDSIGPGWPRGTNWCGLVVPASSRLIFGWDHFFPGGGGTISPYGIRS